MSDLKNIEGPIEKLNRLSAEEARAALLACCGSTRWAERVAALRPFWDVGQSLIIGRRVWQESAPEDWLEAFRAHPRIGESKAARDTGGDARRWSEGEQARAREGSEETLAALAEANKAYEEKFGFIFIICAARRSAEEVLSSLRARMENDRETELRVAADEQWLITEQRVRKFLGVA